VRGAVTKKWSKLIQIHIALVKELSPIP